MMINMKIHMTTEGHFYVMIHFMKIHDCMRTLLCNDKHYANSYPKHVLNLHHCDENQAIILGLPHTPIMPISHIHMSIGLSVAQFASLALNIHVKLSQQYLSN